MSLISAENDGPNLSNMAGKVFFFPKKSMFYETYLYAYV